MSGTWASSALGLARDSLTTTSARRDQDEEERLLYYSDSTDSCLMDDVERENKGRGTSQKNVGSTDQRQRNVRT